MDSSRAAVAKNRPYEPSTGSGSGSPSAGPGESANSGRTPRSAPPAAGGSSSSPAVAGLGAPGGGPGGRGPPGAAGTAPSRCPRHRERRAPGGGRDDSWAAQGPQPRLRAGLAEQREEDPETHPGGQGERDDPRGGHPRRAAGQADQADSRDGAGDADQSKSRGGTVEDQAYADRYQRPRHRTDRRADLHAT